MVFVPFTGIDNHHRNVTFAAALLTSETAESYQWLLQRFKDCLGSEPRVVVTDQDPAMKKAIKAEFTTSRHRLCMWHIMKKLADKVIRKKKYFYCYEDLLSYICYLTYNYSVDLFITICFWYDIYLLSYVLF